MVVGHKRKLNRVGDALPNFVLNSEVIQRVEKMKYLGININESPNWRKQYKTIKNKCRHNFTKYVRFCDTTVFEKA